MKQKDDQKKKDVDFVNFKQTEISNVLIEIDVIKPPLKNCIA